MIDRGFIKQSNRKVWAFLGDGKWIGPNHSEHLLSLLEKI